MAVVQKSEVFCFPVHAKLKPQPNQRILPLGDANSRRTAWRRSDYFYPEMIPEPDYSDTEDESSSYEEDEESENEQIRGSRRDKKKEDESDVRRRKPGPTPQKEGKGSSRKGLPPEKPKDTPSRRAGRRTTDEGLIEPKKPANPYLESSERQQLHKELKFSQKYGKGVVSKKSELQIALEKYKDGKMKKDLAATGQTSLEKILEQQAKKIEMQEMEGFYSRPEWIDRLQHPLGAAPDPKTDEFFRVHAKVVSNTSWSRSTPHSSRCSMSRTSSATGSSSSTRSGSILSAGQSAEYEFDED